MDCASFANQGLSLSAVRQLSGEILSKFSLMLCLQHLIGNMRAKFPDLIKHNEKGATIQADMDDAADAENMVMFFDAINDVVMAFIDVGADIPTVVDMAFCVLRTHPSHWTVFGDTPTFAHCQCKEKVTKFLGPLEAIQLFSAMMEDFEEEGTNANFDVLHTAITSCHANGKEAADSFQLKKCTKTTSPIAHVATTKEMMWRSHSITHVWS